MASHELELRQLSERLDHERQRRLLALRDKLAERKKRKVDHLRRKQEAEITQEMIIQQKELDDIRGKKVCDLNNLLLLFIGIDKVKLFQTLFTMVCCRDKDDIFKKTFLF